MSWSSRSCLSVGVVDGADGGEEGGVGGFAPSSFLTISALTFWDLRNYVVPSSCLTSSALGLCKTSVDEASLREGRRSWFPGISSFMLT